MMTSADRVKEAIGLAEKKMKVTDIAYLMGVTRQSVYAWKRGENTNLTGESLVELAEISSLNARWIALGKGPKHGLTDDEKTLIEGFRLGTTDQRDEWLMVAGARIRKELESKASAA